MTNKEEVTGIATFALMFDRFYDSLNVSNFTTGTFRRKLFQLLYRSADDFRIKAWIITHYKMYLLLIICIITFCNFNFLYLPSG